MLKLSIRLVTHYLKYASVARKSATYRKLENFISCGIRFYKFLMSQIWVESHLARNIDHFLPQVGKTGYKTLNIASQRDTQLRAKIYHPFKLIWLCQSFNSSVSIQYRSVKNFCRLVSRKQTQQKAIKMLGFVPQPNLRIN
jgi:hypothetical protein